MPPRSCRSRSRLLAGAVPAAPTSHGDRRLGGVSGLGVALGPVIGGAVVDGHLVAGHLLGQRAGRRRRRAAGAHGACPSRTDAASRSTSPASCSQAPAVLVTVLGHHPRERRRLDIRPRPGCARPRRRAARRRSSSARPVRRTRSSRCTCSGSAASPSPTCSAFALLGRRVRTGLPALAVPADRPGVHPAPGGTAHAAVDRRTDARRTRRRDARTPPRGQASARHRTRPAVDRPGPGWGCSWEARPPTPSVPGLVLAGVGMGLTFAPAATAVLADMAPDDHGTAKLGQRDPEGDRRGARRGRPGGGVPGRRRDAHPRRVRGRPAPGERSSGPRSWPSARWSPCASRAPPDGCARRPPAPRRPGPPTSPPRSARPDHPARPGPPPPPPTSLRSLR